MPDASREKALWVYLVSAVVLAEIVVGLAVWLVHIDQWEWWRTFVGGALIGLPAAAFGWVVEERYVAWWNSRHDKDSETDTR